MQSSTTLALEKTARAWRRLIFYRRTVLYKIECDWERTGELRVAVSKWQLEGMQEEANLRNKYGDNVEVLSKEEIQSRVMSPTYQGALFDHDGTALVDPARLVWGLEQNMKPPR